MGKYDELPGFHQGSEEIVREGERKMFHQSVENEVEELIKQWSSLKDKNGRRTVKRNVYLLKREIQTEVGSINVKSLGLK